MESVFKILVPTDFSSCSENALVYALQLADTINASITVLNVPDIDTSNLENPVSAFADVEKQMSQARKQLVAFIDKATKDISVSMDKLPPIETNIEVGNVHSTICEEASKKGIHYIVMGTQGQNSTLDKYLGSVASNALKNAPCPVLVVPEKAEFVEQVSMAYATDFSDAEPADLLATIKLFTTLQPTVKFVHFNEKGEENEKGIAELKKYIAQSAPKLEVEMHVLPSTDKVKDMNDFVEDQGINMLVMYKPKRGFLQSIFHSSYTQNMAKHTKIPLLVFKEN